MLKLFSAPCKCKLQFIDQEKRKRIDVTRDTNKGPITEPLYLFTENDPVCGVVNISPFEGKRIEHNGIEIRLVGQIIISHDSPEKHEFVSIVKQLALAGELKQDTAFVFDFGNFEKPYESYNGINARLRYYVRVTISTKKYSTFTEEFDFWVQNTDRPSEVNTGIKMEVGIEELLHIEFEYNRSRYHIRDVILGKIYFLLVKIKIKHMELTIIKRETIVSSTGGQVYNDSDTIAKFEIMDGCPINGESVPVRLFLGGFRNVTPTYKQIGNKFSVKYYLNLVLVDEEERRYYKQQEIVLWRREL